MSKLEKLIAELCPDGVEYKSIREIAEVGTGNSNGNESVDNGLFPFFVRSQTIKSKDDYEYDEEAIIIPGEGGIGEIFHYINGKYALHQRVYRIHFIVEDVNTKFAYYYMQAYFKPFILKKAVSATVTSIRKPVTKGNREAGEYPYYGASGIVDYVSDYIFDGDYLLVSEDGANLLARSTPIAFSISGKNWVNNHAHVLKFDTAIMQKYVEIYLNSIDLSKYISGGAQPKLNQDNLNKIPIPVPPFNKVKIIVAILEKFSALCNDLTSGLPAEIEARKKQYEYYRDKLLTFQEAKI